MDARILALLRKGALGSLERKLDYTRNCLHPRKLGEEVQFKATVVGRNVSSMASFDFGNARPASRGATQSASRFSWDTEVPGPKMRSDGGSSPDLAGRLYQFCAPKHSESCRAVILKDAMVFTAEEARGVAKKIQC